jgi:hypothetical protein
MGRIRWAHGVSLADAEREEDWMWMVPRTSPSTSRSAAWSDRGWWDERDSVVGPFTATRCKR